MCGIFGYYNYQVARDRATILSFLINGLRRLEYRGYDSSGICIDGTVEDSEAACNGYHDTEEQPKQNGSFLVLCAEVILLLLFCFGLAFSFFDKVVCTAHEAPVEKLCSQHGRSKPRN